MDINKEQAITILGLMSIAWNEGLGCSGDIELKNEIFSEFKELKEKFSYLY